MEILSKIMLDTINKISAANRATGWMALEMYASAEEERWYPALAALFMLVEQSLRWATDAPGSEQLFHIMNRARSEKLITEKELVILHSVRDYRNQYLHANFHAEALAVGGMIYPISEAETAQLVFESIAPSCLKIILKLNKISKD